MGKGGCGGQKLTAEEIEAKKKDKQIQATLKSDFNSMDQIIKLLLLGAGESGKSTIFKQMMILYGDPRTEQEAKDQTKIVYQNTILAIQKLAEQSGEWGLDDGIADKAALETVMGLNANGAVTIDDAVGAAVKTLWADKVLQEVWDRRAEFQIVDSMIYFFENIDRISAGGYVASEQDFLHTRVRTTGVVTNRFTISDANFEMYDVGGQRNERKKWIHVFDNVTAVIFVAAISEYDQTLLEDASQNRMVEALQLFKEVCDLEVFQTSSMILFLNKRDLFEMKLQKSPIQSVSHFSDFNGGSNSEAGMEYFRDKFLEQNTNDERTVYYHITCATDTENVNSVFTDCKDAILDQNISASGF